MNRLFLGISAVVVGCATSMTPTEFMEKLPNSTNSKFYDRARASSAISEGSCKLQATSRRYAAPIGFTVDDDLRNGARGIDEWVRIDRGNAYVINNFEWIAVGDKGATQLLVYFDTMACK